MYLRGALFGRLFYTLELSVHFSKRGDSRRKGGSLSQNRKQSRSIGLSSKEAKKEIMSILESNDYQPTEDSPKSYSAIGIAKYIVQYCLNKKVYISNTKMQKLLYFVYGFFLQKKNRQLFPETFGAWKYGPVNREAYAEFCQFGGESLLLWGDEEGIAQLSEEDKAFVDGILDKYLEKDVSILIADTHKSGYAWDKTRSKNQDVINPEIAIDDIREEFNARASRRLFAR